MRLLWWYAPFVKSIQTHLSRDKHDSRIGGGSSTAVRMVHGTEDEFTGVSVFRGICDRVEGLSRVQIDGAGHFWGEDRDSQRLGVAMREWLWGPVHIS